MSRRRRAVIGAAAALSVAHPYPGERQAHDPWLDLIEKAAQKHWQDRGVTVGSIPIDVASNLDDTDNGDAVARGGDGRVVISDRYVGSMLKRARSRKLTTRDRRLALQGLGRVVAHELGHAAASGNVGHTPSGLMAADADVGSAPWEVKQLSRQLIKRHPKRDRRIAAVAGGGMRAGG